MAGNGTRVPPIRIRSASEQAIWERWLNSSTTNQSRINGINVASGWDEVYSTDEVDAGTSPGIQLYGGYEVVHAGNFNSTRPSSMNISSRYRIGKNFENLFPKLLKLT